MGEYQGGERWLSRHLVHCPWRLESPKIQGNATSLLYSSGYARGRVDLVAFVASINITFTLTRTAERSCVQGRRELPKLDFY